MVSNKTYVSFYSPQGTRIWYPDVEEKPLVGTIYKNLEEAFLFYKEYSRKSGFACKKSSSWNPGKSKNPKNKYFKCNKEGVKYVKPATKAIEVAKANTIAKQIHLQM